MSSAVRARIDAEIALCRFAHQIGIRFNWSERGENKRIDLVLEVDRVFQVLAQGRDNVDQLLVRYFEAHQALGITHFEVNKIAEPQPFRCSRRKRACPVGP